MKIELSPLEIRALRAAANALHAKPPTWGEWAARALTPDLCARLEASEDEAWSEIQNLPVRETKPKAISVETVMEPK